MEPILNAIEKLRALEEHRDKLIKLSRELIKLSRKAVVDIRLGKLDDASNKIKEAESLLKEAREIIVKNSMILERIMANAIQEYVEASAFLSLVKNGNLPTYEELRVDPSTYLLGIADVIGELKRLLIDKLREWDIEGGERILALMDSIFVSLLEWDLPDSMSPGLRRKIDIMRGVLENARVITLESKRALHLINKLEEKGS